MGLFDGLGVSHSPARARNRQLSRPIFSRPAGWNPTEDLPELHGYVALDTENKDLGLAAGRGSCWPHRDQGFNCGFAISWEQGDFYLPVAHSEGNVDPARVRRWLTAQARKPDVTFVYANCQHDLGWLWREGIEPVNHPVDVQGMAALLDEFKFSYSLDSLGREYLGRGKSDEEFMAACAAGGLVDPKSNMDLVPAWIAEAYGVGDSRLTLDLFHDLAPKLTAENLDEVHALERECYLVGFDMKRIGVRADTAKAERWMTHFERLRDQKLREVYDATGVHCTATDNAALARALRVENPVLDLPKTREGRDSVRKDVLVGLSSPVADAINAARRYDKAISTFFRGYILESTVNGRIHADFNPLRRSETDDNAGYGGMKGTTSGRWSCTDPNLQNVPTRDSEIGPAVRECVLPEEGEDWGKLDFNSQEARIAVHLAELANLRGAREMGDRYRANPRTDLHRETAQLMGIDRQEAKTINFAILYGAGKAEIARRLGLPTAHIRLDNGDVVETAGPEAARLIRLHGQNIPFIRAFQTEVKKWADRRGWIKTLGGRRVRFQRNGDGTYKRTYKACNGAVQGGAADQMKRAQVRMRREGYIPSIVIHDDANKSIPRGEAGARMVGRLKEIMESAVVLTVPVLADVKIGANWAEVRG
jgi:DNA polymerase I-like protein with 3'-5' exonuclease and polymerase domains